MAEYNGIMVDSGGPASEVIGFLGGFLHDMMLEKLRQISQGLVEGESPLFPPQEGVRPSLGELLLAEEVEFVDDISPYNIGRFDGEGFARVLRALRPEQARALSDRLHAGWLDLIVNDDRTLSCYLGNSLGSYVWYIPEMPLEFIETLLEVAESAYVSGRIKALPEARDGSAPPGLMASELHGRMVQALMKSAAAVEGAAGVDLARTVARHAKASANPIANHRWYSNIGNWNAGPREFMGGYAWAVYRKRFDIALLLLEEGAHPLGHHLEAMAYDWKLLIPCGPSHIYRQWWDKITEPDLDSPVRDLFDEEGAKFMDALLSLGPEEVISAYPEEVRGKYALSCFREQFLEWKALWFAD